LIKKGERERRIIVEMRGPIEAKREIIHLEYLHRLPYSIPGKY